jgi:hypothetical protein
LQPPGAPQPPPLQPYTWVDRKGRPSSPPPRFRQYHRDKLRKVPINLLNIIFIKEYYFITIFLITITFIKG